MGLFREKTMPCRASGFSADSRSSCRWGGTGVPLASPPRSDFLGRSVFGPLCVEDWRMKKTREKTRSPAPPPYFVYTLYGAVLINQDSGKKRARIVLIESSVDSTHRPEVEATPASLPPWKGGGDRPGQITPVSPGPREREIAGDQLLVV